MLDGLPFGHVFQALPRYGPRWEARPATSRCFATSFISKRAGDVRYWPKADMPKNAIDVAIGGKADMPYCGANVCF
jgi:hypothetical protein